jgi:heptosyltransferase-1
MADRRVGPAWADRRERSSAIWINRPMPAGEGHAVDRALALLDALELPREPADFGGDKLFPEVPEGAAALLDQRSSPYYLIHPGAGWGNKRYPPERWAEVARRLKEITWIDTLAVAGPGEIELTERIEAEGQGAVRAIKAPTLPFLAALIRRSVLVLGGDTGPVHLARALGTPVLALMGPTDPATHGPYDLPRQAMALKLPCSYCHQRLEEPRACLLDIEPQDVAERAAAALEGPAPALD